MLFGVMEYLLFHYLINSIFIIFLYGCLSFVNFVSFLFAGNRFEIIGIFIFGLIRIFIFYIANFVENFIAINQTVFVQKISFISFYYINN